MFVPGPFVLTVAVSQKHKGVALIIKKFAGQVIQGAKTVLCDLFARALMVQPAFFEHHYSIGVVKRAL